MNSIVCHKVESEKISHFIQGQKMLSPFLSMLADLYMWHLVRVLPLKHMENVKLAGKINFIDEEAMKQLFK